MNSDESNLLNGYHNSAEINFDADNPYKTNDFVTHYTHHNHVNNFNDANLLHLKNNSNFEHQNTANAMKTNSLPIINSIQSHNNMDLSNPKCCIFCYQKILPAHENIFILNDISLPICPVHLPCQALYLETPTCVECGRTLENRLKIGLDKYNSTDNKDCINLDLCGAECLTTFLPRLDICCFNCHKVLTSTSFGQYCLRLENRSVRQFCSDECLEKFNPLNDYCVQCHKDLGLTPTTEENKASSDEVLKFCSEDCVDTYQTRLKNQQSQFTQGYLERGKCFVCEKENQPIIQHFIKQGTDDSNDPGLVNVCSTQCITQFLVKTQIPPHHAYNCNDETTEKSYVSNHNDHSKISDSSTSENTSNHPTENNNYLNQKNHMSLNKNLMDSKMMNGPATLTTTSQLCEYCARSMEGLTSMTALTVEGQTLFFCGPICANQWKKEGNLLSPTTDKNISNTNHQIEPESKLDKILDNQKSKKCHSCNAIHSMQEMLTYKAMTDKGGMASSENYETLYFCSQKCLSLIHKDSSHLQLSNNDSSLNTDLKSEVNKDKNNNLKNVINDNASESLNVSNTTGVCDGCQKTFTKVRGMSQFTFPPATSDNNVVEGDAKRQEFCSFPCLAMARIRAAPDIKLPLMNTNNFSTKKLEINDKPIINDGKIPLSNDSIVGTTRPTLSNKNQNQRIRNTAHYGRGSPIYGRRSRGRPVRLKDAPKRQNTPSSIDSGEISHKNEISESKTTNLRSKGGSTPSTTLNHSKEEPVKTDSERSTFTQDGPYMIKISSSPQKTVSNKKSVDKYDGYSSSNPPDPAFNILLELLRKTGLALPNNNLKDETSSMHSHSKNSVSVKNETSSQTDASKSWPIPPIDVKNKSTSVRPLVRSTGTNTEKVETSYHSISRSQKPMHKSSHFGSQDNKSSQAEFGDDDDDIDIQQQNYDLFDGKNVSEHGKNDKQLNQKSLNTSHPIIIPIPVPFYIPYPVHGYTSYTPIPLALPVPIVVPTFIPTTIKQADDIASYIKGIKDKLPSDPLQAELLTMADMVEENERINPNITLPQDETPRLKAIKSIAGSSNANITNSSNSSSTMTSIQSLIENYNPYTTINNNTLTTSKNNAKTDMATTTLSSQSNNVVDNNSIIANSTGDLLQMAIQFDPALLGIPGYTPGTEITAIPYQNVDGSIGYATLDSSGTLTPIDANIVQQLQLLQANQQLTAETQVNQNIGNDMIQTKNISSSVSENINPNYKNNALNNYNNSTNIMSTHGLGATEMNNVNSVKNDILSVTNGNVSNHLTNNLYNKTTSHDTTLSSHNANQGIFSNLTNTTVHNFTHTSQLGTTQAVQSDMLVVAKNIQNNLNEWMNIDFSPPYALNNVVVNNTLNGDDINQAIKISNTKAFGSTETDKNILSTNKLDKKVTHLEPAFGVGAFKFWVATYNSVLLQGGDQNITLLKDDPLQYTTEDLANTMTLFATQIRKPDGTKYTADTVYYFCLAIQLYLYRNGLTENLFIDLQYPTFTTTINDVLLSFVPQFTPEGLILSRVDEEILWDAHQLGVHSPHVLLNTIMYYNTKFFHLTTLEAHLAIRFDHIVRCTKRVKLNNQETSEKTVLRYYPKGVPISESTTENVVMFEQAENTNDPMRCPVRLFDFYLSKCPPESKIQTETFYLVPRLECNPNDECWFKLQTLPDNVMAQMFNRIFIVRETLESNLNPCLTNNTPASSI